ncbi:hypothetical protein Nepgr_011459 [Nepenthes gracilis]|uniref:Uncharacterized protein n=1 Tax=Nepenthes gracilis TaxID=150966 RepID=A0AAD3SE85_NEPGR|nr:hypothetical protein Nepgr_011459 [Nepenthes gracilis]
MALRIQNFGRPFGSLTHLTGDIFGKVSWNVRHELLMRQRGNGWNPTLSRCPLRNWIIPFVDSLFALGKTGKVMMTGMAPHFARLNKIRSGMGLKALNAIASGVCMRCGTRRTMSVHLDLDDLAVLRLVHQLSSSKVQSLSFSCSRLGRCRSHKVSFTSIFTDASVYVDSFSKRNRNPLD